MLRWFYIVCPLLVETVVAWPDARIRFLKAEVAIAGVAGRLVDRPELGELPGCVGRARRSN
jgi:hypothetical protein